MPKDNFEFNSNITNETIYNFAKRRLIIKRYFFTHFGIYCVLNFSIILLNIFTYHGKFWALWPMFLWGIVLAIHLVFTIAELNLSYKTDAIQKEMDYIKKKINEVNEPK